MMFEWPHLTLGDKQRYDNLTVVPLSAPNAGHESLCYNTIGTSPGNSIDFVEVDDRGHIGKIVVRNRGGLPLVILEGDQFCGAKQDRIATKSLIIERGAEQRIPVCCVEKGRWAYKPKGPQGLHASEFSGSVRVRSSLRTRTCENTNLQTVTQSAVWNAVEHEQQSLKISSQTYAMSDTFSAYHNQILVFRKKLVLPESSTGYACAVGQNVIAIEIFLTAELCRVAWQRQIGGFVVDSLISKLSPCGSTKSIVAALLRRLRNARWQNLTIMGAGKLVSAELSPYYSTRCLHHRGRLIHCSVLRHDRGNLANHIRQS